MIYIKIIFLFEKKTNSRDLINWNTRRAFYTNKDLFGTPPVSYTHLDVYKRQSYNSEINYLTTEKKVLTILSTLF